MKEKKNNILLKGAIWTIKSLVIGISLLFIYNIVGSYFSLHVPINIWTIIIVSVLKLPGLVSIIIFMLILPKQ